MARRYGEGGSMMARRGVFGLLAGAASALSLGGCGDNSDTMGRSYDYRYKLIVEVDTPGGVQSGSSVNEVSVGMSGTIVPKAWRGGSSHVRGEAVAVDVAPGETLFVLLRSEHDPDWATSAAEVAYASRIGSTVTPPDIDRYYAELKANRQVWPVGRRRTLANEEFDNYPYFVRFRDARDPKSVEQVDPDNLAKSFGQGINLRGFAIQITDAPMSAGIEKRLGWLTAQHGSLVKYPSLTAISEMPAVHQLDEGAFWRKQ
jgi:hypothetical protein